MADTPVTDIVFPPNSNSAPGFSRYEPLLTVSDLKKIYLFGVDFKGPNGDEIPEEVFESAIRVGISRVEHTLDMTIAPTTYIEEYDYNINDYMNYGFIKLYHSPILDTPRVSARYIKEVTLFPFPENWIRVFRQEGQIQIVPTSGSLSQFNIDQTGFLPVIFGVKHSWPQLFHIEYSAGFEQDKIPAMLNRLIGVYAAISSLAILGELPLGQGISSTSISLDGLSQSVSSVKGATTSGVYNGRITLYAKEAEELTLLAKNYYQGGFKLLVS